MKQQINLKKYVVVYRRNNIMNENVVIEDQKLNRIVKRIIQLENENVKTREYNDEDIKKKIEKIIIN